MLRILAAIVALFIAFSAAALVIVDRRHRRIKDPRRASPRAVRLAKLACASALVSLVFMAFSMAAQARPSPYPGVTQFAGDRYSASAQMGADVARAARCPPPACQRKRAGREPRKRPPVSRKRWRDVPMPVPRPLADPGSVEPLSVAGGAWREAKRAVGRPRAWCGWWLGHHLGMPLRHLWLARNWAGVGSNAGGPAPGVVVVWRHHVGIITGRNDKGWIVKSGNDGRAVRERARSIAGAIAFRNVGWRS